MLRYRALSSPCFRVILLVFLVLVETSSLVAAPNGRPAAVPGRIEAEDYNNGGEGVGYHDDTPGNALGLYRKDDVDVGAINPDGTGGFDVGDIATGEWLKYDIDVSSSGNYDFQVRAATAAFKNQSVIIEIDGTNVTGDIFIPNTQSWSNYQTVTTPNIRLSSGFHVMRIVMGGADFNIDWVQIVHSGGNQQEPAAIPPPISTPSPIWTPAAPVPAVSPSSGSGISVPGTILGVNYNLGGEGVAYHDTTPGNKYNVCRHDDVDINVSYDIGCGYVIAGIDQGEWLKYNIDVAATGTYNLQVRTATNMDERALHVEIDGTNVTGSVVLPNTVNYLTFQTTTIPNINLQSGSHVMRVYFETNMFDFNWIKVVQQ